MPTDVWEAAKYSRPRLLSKLGDAKLWPVKLSAYKHQDSLRHLDLLMCVLLYTHVMFGCMRFSLKGDAISSAKAR